MSQVSDMDMTPQFQMWIDEASKAFGGLVSFLFVKNV
jgi:hypothetical protein